jgi:hypothetical protein
MSCGDGLPEHAATSALALINGPASASAERMRRQPGQRAAGCDAVGIMTMTLRASTAAVAEL